MPPRAARAPPVSGTGGASVVGVKRSLQQVTITRSAIVACAVCFGWEVSVTLT